jgi:hypothetical protein
VTAFFIPGVDDDARSTELAYVEMRRQIQVEMGRNPSTRRILRLWARRGSVDCITEVGMPDPLRGGTVMAIFDMGPHQPFVVWRHLETGVRHGAREVLACTAYQVSEFDL